MVDETSPSVEDDTTKAKEENLEDTSAGQVGEEETNAPTVPPPLKGLVVLPPRQKEKSSDEVCLGLPPLRPEEPVQSIRMALTEVIGYAHITNYRLELEEGYERKTDDEDPTVPPPLVSPYTGTNAVVSVSVHLRSLNQAPSIVVETEEASPVLDDFADLQSTASIRDGSAIRMVLESYDAASIRDHVIRLRQLFAGNPPSVTSLVADSKESTARETKLIRDPLSLPVPADGKIRMDYENLCDFFYLACGEDPAKYHTDGTVASSNQSSKSKKKKKKAAATATGPETKEEPTEVVAMTEEELMKYQAVRMNELEEIMKIPCSVQYSGFHPPPAYRKLIGDLAYLEVTFPAGEGNGTAAETTLFITATTTGFYVNKCKFTGPASTRPPVFDPSPATESCFAHSLLDCLLKASPFIKSAWEQSLAAVKERAELFSRGNTSNFQSFLRLAIRGDFGSGDIDPSFTLDAHLGTPTWLVPRGQQEATAPTWQPSIHQYNSIRAEEELTNTFGVDLRAGSMRDWNDEIQMAREMSTEKIQDRMERARVLHKIMAEFGEAALQGVQAVTQGQVMPMNPNEGTRTQVFLHNNIFISRALDVGPDTFRLTKGDAASKKSVSREIQCIKTLQRMEHTDLCTLGTVLIDYRGSRFMCQSVLPGILSGDKCHKVLLGSVDTELPLNWAEDIHQTLATKLGEPLNLRSAPLFKSPLTEARKEECRKMKKSPPVDPTALNGGKTDTSEEEKKVDDDEKVETCVPIESKVIQGSDQRKYILDFARMTPRDANWVSESKGGTGRWESVQKDNGTTRFVPSSIDDDEWTTHILRPELINRWVRFEYTKALEAKRAAAEEELKKNSEEDKEDKEKADTPTVTLTEEEQKKLTDGLRLNVNVFFPDVRTGDEERAKEDESRARQAANFLWDDLLPRITKGVRDRSGPPIPTDGKSLTELMHRNGVNCRYLGRLATLALLEEKKDQKTSDDIKHGRMAVVERMTMPKCWLELLECEMVARAAKHVLDSYLSEHCTVASWSPAQTVASFLSALISEQEESAAQTENRQEKESGSRPDDDDMQALKEVDVGGDGDAVPMASRSRTEIWQDIEMEIARRFRYSLILFNRGGSTSERAMYIPVLRRVCQRCGIRLAAKSYKVGGVCYTGGNSFGGRMTATYPISPLDVVDVVPLMKHSAGYHEGFAMCSFGPGNMCSPPLQVSLADARVALERAHVQLNGKALGPALELAQEAANLYQRVTENPSHPGIVECLELMASVFFEANDPTLAAENCVKALGLAVQGGGFDNATVFGLHMSLFQMFYSAKELDRCVKHLRAGIYILGLMGGQNHYELNGTYLKMLTAYKHEDVKGKYNSVALDVYRVLNELDPSDRLMEGLSERRFAQTLADCGEYKEAMEAEKRAYSTLSRFVGPDHDLVKNCDKSLKDYTKLAVEKGKGLIQTEQMKKEAEIADAVAAEIAAAEEDDEKKKKKAINKKKKGKK